MAEVPKLPDRVDNALAQGVKLADGIAFGAVGLAKVLSRWPMERITLAGDWKRPRYRHLGDYAGMKSPDNLVVASGFVRPMEADKDDEEALEQHRRHNMGLAERLATTLIRGRVMGGKRNGDETIPRAVIMQPAALATSPPIELEGLTQSAVLTKAAIEAHSSRSKPLIESERPIPLYVAEKALEGKADAVLEPVHRELEVAENILKDRAGELGFEGRPAITMVLFADPLKAVKMFNGIRLEDIVDGAARLENPRANRWLPLARTALPSGNDEVQREHRFRRTDVAPPPDLIERRGQGSSALV